MDARARSFLLKAFITSIAALALLPDSAIAGPVKPADLSRIVSIGGDVTEILYDLGAESHIVAVDSTSQMPPRALKDKASIGYMRTLSAESVLAVDPSVIIAAAGAGPEESVSLLKSSSVPYIEVPEDDSPDGIAAKIRFIASMVGKEKAGEQLAERVEQSFKSLAADRMRIRKPVRALFVLSVQGGRATVGGRGTSADSILRLAGAENAADAISGFKPISDEAALELAPDVIVTMPHGDPTPAPQRIREVKGLDDSPAVKNGRIVEMNGLYLLGFGPRAAFAARDLMDALYPHLAASPAGAGK